MALWSSWLNDWKTLVATTRSRKLARLVPPR